MSKTLQILMPMGGLGSRFAKEGFTTPKPLIDVDGKPMFLSAAGSFDAIDAPKTLTFVIRQEHVDQFGLDDLIREKYAAAQVVVIPKLTRGAAETAYAAMGQLNPDDPLVIMDCDFKFTSSAYADMAQGVVNGSSDIAGGLLTFESQDPRYSYALTDDTGTVIRTAEKQAISSHAIWGAYFFAQAATFAKGAESIMARPLSDTMKEYYISFVYNEILADGGVVKAAPVDSFASFGTPEELDTYVGHHVEQVKALIHKYSSPELWRYLSMAAVLVGVEIVVFQLMIWGHISYLIATPASMIVGIVLNWYISRAYVFKHRPHRARKEFALVVVGSLVGIVLQLAVTSFVVEMMKAAPIIGKLLAICVTFFLGTFGFASAMCFTPPAIRPINAWLSGQ